MGSRIWGRNMSTTYLIPTSESVSSLLGIIFGDDLSASECDSPELNDRYVATFIDGDDKLVALCVSDKEFVAYSGAALAMIPANVAEEMISGNAVTDALVENFYEVMNICSKLMMTDSGAHLRLDKTMNPDQSADTVASLRESSQVIGFGVDIPRYGKGTLTFVVT